MFISKNKVRMHDMDMAKLLYFPRQFRFVHEALEEFMQKAGLSFNRIFTQLDYMFVIVHCEADYLGPLKIGDLIEIQMSVQEIKTTSFTFNYKIFKEDGQKVGAAKTVHVTLNKADKKKIPIPEEVIKSLRTHLCSK